jgi:hypothetical protein
MSAASLPDVSTARVVVSAPDVGAGSWAGAASATVVDDEVWLAYRVRRPLGEGRGVSTVVARSSDGLAFDTVCTVYRDGFGAESFERPVVLRRPGGGWRLYLSCATPGSKHWWVEALDADSPEDLPTGRRTVVFPGSATVAEKDPVIRVDEHGWHAWVCEHPLTEPDQEDRMSTAYHHSDDGLVWRRHGTVLSPRVGTWDARGARVSEALSLDPLVVAYDGRPSAADNWHETTGVARATGPGPGSPLVADDAGPLRSPHSDGAFRYLSSVRLGGRTLFYAELANADGGHDTVVMTS